MSQMAFTDNNNLEASDDLTNKLLTFIVDGATYGIELSYVVDILYMLQITKVPNVPPYIKGIVNLRGKINPVIDVRLKFGKEERPYDDKTCIIVISINGMNVGLIVDEVSEAITLDSSMLSDLPQYGQDESEKYLKSVAKFGERVVLNIDCDKFFGADLSSIY